jgi:hypothetical protein
MLGARFGERVEMAGMEAVVEEGVGGESGLHGLFRVQE